MHKVKQVLAGVFLATANLAPGAALAVPDNLLGAISDPLRMLHMYTAADGSTRIDELTLPARSTDSAATQPGSVKVFLEGSARTVRLLALRQGADSAWHYSREKFTGSTGKATLLLSGTIVRTIAPGRSVTITAGTLTLEDDHAGQGHRTRCETTASDGYCLLLQIELDDAERLFLLPRK